MNRLRVFLHDLLQPYKPSDKYVVRRCGWLWRMFAVYRVEMEEGVGGMCGDVYLFYRVSPKFYSRQSAQCYLNMTHLD